MSEPRLATKPASASSPTSRATPQAPSGARARSRRTTNRSRVQILCVAALALVGVGVIAIVATQFTTRDMSAAAPRLADTKTAKDYRTGKIVLDQPDSSGCRQKTFDNQNGGLAASEAGCNPTPSTVDSSGVPVPRGTIQRLDAINKSFSNR